MIVGIMQVELRIEWAKSLKDKRRVVSSLKDRLHRNHQVSVAEIAPLDQCAQAVLGDRTCDDQRPVRAIGV